MPLPGTSLPLAAATSGTHTRRWRYCTVLLACANCGRTTPHPDATQVPQRSRLPGMHRLFQMSPRSTQNPPRLPPASEPHLWPRRRQSCGAGPPQVQSRALTTGSGAPVGSVQSWAAYNPACRLRRPSPMLGAPVPPTAQELRCWPSSGPRHLPPGGLRLHAGSPAQARCQLRRDHLQGTLPTCLPFRHCGRLYWRCTSPDDSQTQGGCPGLVLGVRGG